jgi:hypothetical protein
MTAGRALSLLKTRLACPQVVTRYFAAALLGSAIAILAAFKL